MRTYMSAFIQKHDGPHNLLVVYYTGHGVYREDHKHLELTASLRPMVKRGFQKEARCNWNKIQELLQEEDVESYDTPCYEVATCTSYLAPLF